MLFVSLLSSLSAILIVVVITGGLSFWHWVRFHPSRMTRAFETARELRRSLPADYPVTVKTYLQRANGSVIFCHLEIYSDHLLVRAGRFMSVIENIQIKDLSCILCQDRSRNGYPINGLALGVGSDRQLQFIDEGFGSASLMRQTYLTIRALYWSHAGQQLPSLDVPALAISA